MKGGILINGIVNSNVLCPDMKTNIKKVIADINSLPTHKFDKAIMHVIGMIACIGFIVLPWFADKPTALNIAVCTVLGITGALYQASRIKAMLDDNQSAEQAHLKQLNKELYQEPERRANSGLLLIGLTIMCIVLFALTIAFVMPKDQQTGNWLAATFGSCAVGFTIIAYLELKK